MFRPSTSVLLLFIFALICFAQTSTTPSGARGVVRLRVRVKVGEATKGLPRKRFFLIKGSADQNKAAIDAIQSQPLVSRDCYYRGIGASEALIKWLKENDCESVYCRELGPEDVDGPSAVPEFQAALATSEKEFGSRDLARKWLTVNLPEKFRDGFYRNRQAELQRLIRLAQETSGATVMSVMGDRNGTAFFTDLEPGAYVISSILPAEIGNTSVTWNCPIQVKPGDLATVTPYLVSNKADRNVKCVGVEKPLPTCEAPR
jgi:hypothetical protein